MPDFSKSAELTWGEGAPLRPPARSILADEVYGIIREGLVSARIQPGSRLNLDRLARELHVSNTPVRQALARLESEGLVTKEPYRGFTASRLLDSRTIADLYEYRLMIEPPTAARAARHSDDSNLDELDRLCDQREIDALLEKAAADDLAQRDADFHYGIALLAGNTIVIENLAATLDRMRMYTAYHRSGAGDHAWQEHRTIAAALRAGDPQTAAEAMRKHLMDAFDRMKTTL